MFNKYISKRFPWVITTDLKVKLNTHNVDNPWLYARSYKKALLKRDQIEESILNKENYLSFALGGRKHFPKELYNRYLQQRAKVLQLIDIYNSLNISITKTQYKDIQKLEKDYDKLIESTYIKRYKYSRKVEIIRMKNGELWSNKYNNLLILMRDPNREYQTYNDEQYKVLQREYQEYVKQISKEIKEFRKLYASITKKYNLKKYFNLKYRIRLEYRRLDSLYRSLALKAWLPDKLRVYPTDIKNNLDLLEYNELSGMYNLYAHSFGRWHSIIRVIDFEDTLIFVDDGGAIYDEDTLLYVRTQPHL